MMIDSEAMVGAWVRDIYRARKSQPGATFRVTRGKDVHVFSPWDSVGRDEARIRRMLGMPPVPTFSTGATP